MARRKNTKRFDPRYFLHERLDVDSLAQQVANEPELENQLRAMPQEFDEKTSKPQFADKLELVRSFVLQTEPFTSGESGWIPGEAEAVAKRALQLVFDRTAKFETVNRVRRAPLFEGKEEAKELYLRLVKKSRNHRDWKGGYGNIMMAVTTGGGMKIGDVEIPPYGLEKLEEKYGVTAEDVMKIKSIILQNPDNTPDAANYIRRNERKFEATVKRGDEKDYADIAFLKMYRRAGQTSRADTAGAAFDTAFGEALSRSPSSRQEDEELEEGVMDKLKAVGGAIARGGRSAEDHARMKARTKERVDRDKAYKSDRERHKKLKKIMPGFLDDIFIGSSNEMKIYDAINQELGTEDHAQWPRGISSWGGRIGPSGGMPGIPPEIRGIMPLLAKLCKRMSPDGDPSRVCGEAGEYGEK